jgi:hypothetical protein
MPLDRVKLTQYSLRLFTKGCWLFASSGVGTRKPASPSRVALCKARQRNAVYLRGCPRGRYRRKIYHCVLRDKNSMILAELYLRDRRLCIKILDQYGDAPAG